MSDEPTRPQLTDDQVIVVYEQTLNRTIVMHLLVMLVGAVVAVAFFWYAEPMLLKIVLVIVTILASGMLQRLLVLRVRCPACGARVLGRIHSIIQARSITHCPGCDAKLRG